MSTTVVAAIAILGLTIGAAIFRDAGRAPLRRWVGDSARAFRAGTQAQIDLQERYLRVQRPWQSDWLRWTPTADGWELAGTVLPPESRHSQPAISRRHPGSGNGAITA